MATATGVRLAEIAEAAGVSVATVSKVMNGRSDVGAETRERVQRVLTESAYVPTRRSRRPRRARVHFDGPLVAYSTAILSGIMAEAHAQRLEVTLTSESDSPVSNERALGATSERQPIVLVTSELLPDPLSALRKAHLPVVLIDPLNVSRPRLRTVGSSNFAGGLAATEHLLDLGHRRIAFLGGPASAACNLARLQGYRSALEAGGVPIGAEYVRHGDFRFVTGREGADALLRLAEPPTAIVAANDELAMGAIEAARVLGLRVPQDLSVVGFDDTSGALMSSPPLTTVHQPLREMGGLALRTAVRLALGETVEFSHVELATELVVRDSTGAPRGRPD